VVLLTLNIGASSILMFVGYSFSRSAIAKRTKENVSQQLETIRDKFDAEHRVNLGRSLGALANAAILNDYLGASEDEKFILRKKIEARFRLLLDDFSSYHHISFIDADGNVAIEAMRQRKSHITYNVQDLNVQEPNDPVWFEPSLKLFEKLKATPLLLFSGGMEWFMPRRQIQVQGPIVSKDGSVSAVAGIAKLDLDTGGFGGIVTIHAQFDRFLADLRDVRFFDENLIWVVDAAGNVLQRPDNSGGKFNFGERLPNELQPNALLLELDTGLLGIRDFSIVPGKPFFRLAIDIPNRLLVKDLRPTIRFFRAVLLISVAVLLFLSLYFSRFLSRPFVKLQQAEGKLANAQRIAKLGHWEFAPRTGKFTASDEAKNIFGIASSGKIITFKNCIDRMHPKDRDTFQEKLNETVKNQTSFRLETTITRFDGSESIVHNEVVVDRASTERDRRIIGTIQDISEIKATEDRIRHLAYYDEVTGLANRTLLNANGKYALASASQHERIAAVLFLDLDHFKNVNDTIGHDAGDELLRKVGARLRKCTRAHASIIQTLDEIDLPTDKKNTVARLGGDEFIVLLTDLSQAADAGTVARRINNAISERIVIAGKDVYTTCSIGISVYPTDGSTTEELLKHADAAMYQAKSSGRNRFEFYSSSIDERVQARISLETRLHKAVAANQFRLLYQPRVNISSGNIVGAEALIRWMDPKLGLVAPDQFISIAEDTGLIVPIGEWVLRTACKQAMTWHARGLADVSMSVNISAVQFNPFLMQTIKHVLTETRLDAKYLELELTESLLIGNTEAASQLVTDLKAMGVQISIDDFGVGYSSLSLLKHLPVDILKIDKSFILDIFDDPDDALIVKTAIELGHNLRLRVVAEGVEQPEQLTFLRKHRCDEAQGYLMGGPMTGEEVIEWFGRKAS